MTADPIPAADPLTEIYRTLYEARELFNAGDTLRAAELFDEGLNALHAVVNVGVAMAAASASPAIAALIEKARTGQMLGRDEIAAACADLEPEARKTVEGWLDDLSEIASTVGDKTVD